MILALDTNVLVYAHLPAMPDHGRVRPWLERQLLDPAVTLGLAPLVLHELVHVITDARRFDPPVSMPEALALARRYLVGVNAAVLPADEAVLAAAVDLMEEHGLGRKRFSDALLAASVLVHGVDELATCNVRDFERILPGKVVDPRAPDA